MRSLLLAIVAMFLVAHSSLVAADKTWTGGGGGAGWQEGANWGVAAPVAGDALIFPNVTKKTATNGFAANTAFGPLTFNAGGYVISGNLINLGGGVFLNGANTTQLALPLALAVPVAFTVSNASGILTVSQPLSGAGGIIKSGAGLLVLNDSATYSGGTIIVGGGIQVGGTLTSAVQISNGFITGTGTVQGITSLNQGVASLAPGTASVLGTLTSVGNVRLYANDRLYFDVNGTTSEKLVVQGTVNLGLAPIEIAMGTAPTLNTDLVLIDNDGTDPVIYDAADPSNYLASVTLNGLPYRVLFVGGTNNNDVVLRQVVSRVPTTFTVSTSNDLIAHGASVTFSVQVSGAVGAPSGDVVSFFDGAELIGTATLNGSGQGTTAAISTLKPGQRKITALFPGNTNYAMSRSTNIVTQSVAGTITTTSLAVTPASSLVGSSTPGELVTLVATVVTNPVGGFPAGAVTFFDGGIALATVAVSSNQAVHATAALLAGAHSLSATYTATGAFVGSFSTAVTHTVTGATTTTTLTSSASSVVAGTDVSFTATVTGGTPTGSVLFRDGAITLGTVTLSGSTAGLTTSGLSAGTHAITASYLGSTEEQPSTSNTVSQVITAAPDGSGSTGGGGDVELQGGCGLGSGVAALILGLLMLVGLRLRRH